MEQAWLIEPRRERQGEVGNLAMIEWFGQDWFVCVENGTVWLG